jgi:holliday junction DNA helicase RuvA
VIGSLRGELLDNSTGELLVEVGGLGYRVQATPATLREAGEVGGTVFLHVHHHRREDAETLFGFTSLDERRVFETLIGTHGVGPALGLAILSVHSPMALRQVLAADDIAALCLIPGVGRKTAARLLVELKSRLEVPVGDAAGAAVTAIGGSDGGASVRSDVRDALAGLGYGAEEIGRVLSELPGEGDSSDLLRLALQRLAAA